MDPRVLLNADFLNSFRPHFTITGTTITQVQIDLVHRILLFSYAFKMNIGVTHGPLSFKQDKLALVCIRRAILEVGLRYQEDEFPHYDGNLHINQIFTNIALAMIFFLLSSLASLSLPLMFLIRPQSSLIFTTNCRNRVSTV